MPDECTQDRACSTPISLTAALAQFQREAVFAGVDTGRYRCSYYAWGNGPALLFIPGLGEDHLSFAMPMSRLKDQFRCITYDLPDGIDDGANLNSYKHNDFVEDLLALIDHLRLSHVHLLGVSFGSTIALCAMARHPELFSRSLLQGGFARRRLAPAESLLASMARYWPGNMSNLPFHQRLYRAHNEPDFAHRPPEDIETFLARAGRHPMKAVARRALLLKSLDLRPLLPRIKQHILLICGDHDHVVNKQCEQELMAGLPLCTRAELENCGHYPQFTQPEVLAELISRFLLG